MMWTGRFGWDWPSFASSLSSNGLYTESHRDRPRARLELMFWDVSWRDGGEGIFATISCGNPSRKAPSTLIVLGMPLKEIHFSPTSRIRPAVSGGEGELGRDVVKLKSSSIDWGEFIV